MLMTVSKGTMEGSGRIGGLRFGVRSGNTCVVREDLLVTKVRMPAVADSGRCDGRCEALGLMQSSIE